MKKRLPSISTTDYIDDAINMIQERDLGVITAMSGDVKPTEGVVEGMLFNDLKNEELSTYHPVERTWNPLIYYKSGNYTKNTIDKSFEPLAENLTKLSTLEDRGPGSALFSFDTPYPISNFYRELLSTSSASTLTSKLSLGALSKFDKISGSTHIQKESITENKTNFASDSFKPFRVGDIVLSAKNTQRDGFVKCVTGATIGSTNATYSGTKYRELYSELWKNPSVKFVNTAGDSVSKGSSVDADWSANKNIVIPTHDDNSILFNQLCVNTGWYNDNNKTGYLTGVNNYPLNDSGQYFPVVALRHGNYLTVVYQDDFNDPEAIVNFYYKITTWDVVSGKQILAPTKLLYPYNNTPYQGSSTYCDLFPSPFIENDELIYTIGTNGHYDSWISKINVLTGETAHVLKSYRLLYPFRVFKVKDYYYTRLMKYSTYKHLWFRSKSLTTLMDTSSEIYNPASLVSNDIGSMLGINKAVFEDENCFYFLKDETLSEIDSNNVLHTKVKYSIGKVKDTTITYTLLNYESNYSGDGSGIDILGTATLKLLYVTRKGFLLNVFNNNTKRRVVLNIILDTTDLSKSKVIELSLGETNEKEYVKYTSLGGGWGGYQTFKVPDFSYYHDEEKGFEFIFLSSGLYISEDGITYNKTNLNPYKGNFIYFEEQRFVNDRITSNLTPYIKY